MEHKPVLSKLPRLTLAREDCIIHSHNSRAVFWIWTPA